MSSETTTIYDGPGGGVSERPASLIDILRRRSQSDPDRRAYTFLVDGEAEEVHLSYGELDRQARAVAAWLQALGMRGERVLLLYAPGLEYVAAFWGCLYAGAVAVPAYPPRLNRNLLRLQSVVSDAQAKVALSTATLLSRLTPLVSQSAELKALQWMATDGLDRQLAEQWQPPEVGGETLAFLQYTSGSTSAPKGVMVSHANLLHNEEMIRRAFRQTEQSVIVGWLPFYHDMGLIGNVLQPLYVGAHCVLMSPVAFLQKPSRWLRAITRYRATTSGGPNFAYDMCVTKIPAEEREGLDLRSWSAAFNGSEPVRAETLERFAEAFEPFGFSRDAFHPCYGLAESTLLVSGGAGPGRAPVVERVKRRALESNLVEAAEGDADSQLLVGCGGAMPGHHILIVNPETLAPCEPGAVGEVWLSGPSVTRGYWGRPEQTAHAFGAYLADGGAGPYLRTGDLGFLSRGELFVTGRLKDLIIIRGRNLYPQDIERTVESSHESLRRGGCAAFSVEVEGEERLAVVQEVTRHAPRDFEEVFECVRQAVSEEHEVQLSAVLLVRQGSVPKTSSGKVQRRACAEMFLAAAFSPLAEWRDAAASSSAPGAVEEPPAAAAAAAPEAPATHGAGEIADWLRTHLAAKLGMEASRVDVNQPVTRYGLDSLLAVELMHEVEAGLGVVLPLSHFLQSPSVAELARMASEQLTEGLPLSGLALATSASREAVHPLSHGQQALWFIHRMAPRSAAYNIPVAVRIHNRVDAAAMRRAFQTLVERHESLRTTFAAVEGSPVQVVHESMEVSFEEYDASEWAATALNVWLVEQAHRPFDLDTGPLLRLSLLRRSAAEFVLLLVAHHIAVDFWSLAILMHELGQLYEAELSGHAARLAAPAITFTDYVRWQRRALEGAEGERLRAYWEGRLGGALPTLNLPTDRPRPPVQTFRGAAHAFKLDAALAARLRELAARHDATLYMTLLAAFQVLLRRYTGQAENVVGSPTAGRNWAALSDIVGYFVNPVALRVDLSGDPGFTELLGEVRRTVLEAFAHQDYPFALLVQHLQPERDPSRTPIFQTMFVLQQAHFLRDEGLAAFALGEEGARLKLGRLDFELLALEQRVAQFDLSLAVARSGETLLASFEYNTSLFDAATVERLAANYRRLLESIVAEPERPISSLPLIAEGERRRLAAWNETRADYESDVCLHQLFERQAARTPDSAAVVFADGQLTYAELNRRADQLARYLRALGVGPESLVGVMMERSPELVIALLGVLKAGGAYVPLDPEYPADRLAFMLEDSGAGVLLTQERLRGRVPETRAHVVAVDSEWAAADGHRAGHLRVPLTPESGAYVIYTSGSTGRPKGAVIPHRAIVNHMLWMEREFGYSPSDTFLQKTPISFDASVWEFYAPLLAGARLVVAEPGAHLEAARLAEACRSEQVTVLQVVPTVLRLLADEPGLGECASLRLVFCGGEALSGELAERFSGRLPGARLHNLYGPTEAAIDATSWEYMPGAAEAVVPIGRPIGNVRAYVQDGWGSLTPVGVGGELHLGGAGLARGYLSRPGLTAERFIPDASGGEAGARLYRTGDVARWAEGGRLEYLGRADHQVKIRGQRIETDEVEAALSEHPSVRECVVVAREDEPGDVRLVAYVVAQEGATPTARELRGLLEQKLPQYMLPSAYVALGALPLTSNGKLDRRALPAPENGTRLALEGEDSAAPRNQLEEMLCVIWGSVLGAERVGTEDNFFDLGGHSLLATQVMWRTREAFGVEVPLRRLFDAPTVAGLAEKIDAAVRADAVLPLQPIERAPRDGGEEAVPLSFAQQRLWILDQLGMGRASYNIPAAVRLRGRLGVAALGQSLGEIVRRHEALRTTFKVLSGQPVQVVAPAGALSLPLIDLRGLPAGEVETAAHRLAAEEARRPFDLARGPLLRARLLKLAEDDHLLLLSVHHIVSDGWSMGLFVRELNALYESLSGGQPSPLSELPIQYADYVRWQRRWLCDALLERQLSYWKGQLAGDLPVLELPADRPRPPAQTYRGAKERVELPRALSEELKALSRRQGATLYMTLLAALQALFHRYTGRPDIAVGTPMAGRARVELENLIGFFVNTLVLRGDLRGDPTFEELLGRARELTLEAHAHQDVPFETLVEELQVERDLSHTPLFQVMFGLENAARPELRLAGVEGEAVEVENGTAKFDLLLLLRETEDGLRGTLEYNTDIFEAGTVRRLLGHFRELLAGVVTDPRRRLSELPVLTAEERRRLLVEWRGQTLADDGRVGSLHGAFEAQAAATPDAVALVFHDQRLTYAELNRRANRLARRLRALGVGPEVLVGVLMGRSVELVVALLGVLKAGGAYVPLDPNYPAERLAFMLADSGARVLLTQRGLLGGLPPHEARVLCLDAESPEPALLNGEDLSAPVAGENLAYVIYTSGSTGRPKGVAITHRSAAVFLDWVKTVYTREQLSGTLASTSVCFDLSVFELFAPLAYGGTIVLAQDALELPSLPAAEAVTLVNTVPSAMAELVRGGGVPAGVRTVNLAGEPLPNSLAQAVYGLGAVERVINLYGPSEDTTYSTAGVAARGATGPPTIGRPVANTQVHLLDGQMGLMAIGAAGELYIGGDGLARGYLKRPDLTAERFIPNPFGATPGARLYRTGDLARWRPDGELEFLGRLDHQVKIRGFRIELGEVEAALGAHPSVAECVVVEKEVEAGDKRLVAYLAARGAEPGAGELRGYLKGKLPDYMIPTFFVTLDALPLTPNGKVDRKALPPPGRARAEAEASFVAPRTQVEKALAEAWEQLLGVERVGVEDNFFDLGGHSLLVTQLVSRVRELFGVELPLRAAFEAATVSELARRVEEAGSAGGAEHSRAVPDFAPPAPQSLKPARAQGPPPPPILPAPRGGPLPLSFAQQRLWFLDRLAPGNSAYNLIGGVRLTGRLDVSALGRALREVVRRHESLRTTFELREGRPVQLTHASCELELPLADLRGLPAGAREAKVQELAREELRRPFDLSRLPLLRVSLLRLADEEHVALVVMHHIISDGWSTALFIREVTTLYEAFAAGRPSPLAELPVQYADYAAWQRGWLQGDALEEQLSYWRRTLGGRLPRQELRGDRPRPQTPTFRCAKLSRPVPNELRDALAGLSRREGVTLFMTLLAAFQTLLFRHTNEDDCVVGTAIAGRNRAETEDLIGCFINMLVLRTDLSGNPRFRELLGRVREVALGAYAHQDMPFDRLVDELEPSRSLSQTPIFQVAFGLQRAPVRSARMGTLSLSPLTFAEETARYDLTLWMMESEDGLQAVWTYSTDLFDPATVGQLHDRFETLLQSAAADPDARLGALRMLSEAEREQETAREREREEEKVRKLMSVRRRTVTRAPAGAE